MIPGSIFVLSRANNITEVLKYPVHTSVTCDRKDFEEFLIEENMHIAINLKDFKAVVAHAETANATVTARYTLPCKPMQLAYEFEGIRAEFTVMTRGEVDGEEVSSARAVIPQLSQRPATAQAATPAPISLRRNETPRVAPSTEMPPPPARARSIRPLKGGSTQENLTPRSTMDRPLASASMDFDSLFVPQDDDRQWDEMNDEDEEEPQDILGWDASGQETFEPVLRDIEPDFSKPAASRKESRNNNDEMGLPPTQRMSQVWFDSVFGFSLVLMQNRSAALVSSTEGQCWWTQASYPKYALCAAACR